MKWDKIVSRCEQVERHAYLPGGIHVKAKGPRGGPLLLQIWLDHEATNNMRKTFRTVPLTKQITVDDPADIAWRVVDELDSLACKWASVARGLV